MFALTRLSHNGQKFFEKKKKNVIDIKFSQLNVIHINSSKNLTKVAILPLFGLRFGLMLGLGLGLEFGLGLG